MSRKRHRTSIYNAAKPSPVAAVPPPAEPDPPVEAAEQGEGTEQGEARPLLTKDAPGMGIPPPPAVPEVVPEVVPSRYSKSPEELMTAATGGRRYGPESDVEELRALNAPLTRPGFNNINAMDSGQLRRFAVAHFGKWYPDDEPETAIRADVQLLMDRDRSPERRVQLGG